MKRSNECPDIVASFRIYPRIGKKLYFTVQVFRTRSSMHRYCRVNCVQYMGSRTTAVCHAFKRFKVDSMGNDRILPEIGKIHFYQSRINPSLVVHEVTHAAIFWMNRIERKDVLTIGSDSPNHIARGTEEDICRATGDMFFQINVRLWKLGIWK